MFFGGEREGRNGHFCTAVFCKNWRQHTRRIGVRGHGYIHRKSVDMDMNMDGKFHVHGKPGVSAFYVKGVFHMEAPSQKPARTEFCQSVRVSEQQETAAAAAAGVLRRSTMTRSVKLLIEAIEARTRAAAGKLYQTPCITLVGVTHWLGSVMSTTMVVTLSTLLINHHQSPTSTTPKSCACNHETCCTTSPQK